jgi:hypothetical protein
MNVLFAALGLLLLLLILGMGLYLFTARRYQSADSVANSYDEWTEDGILVWLGLGERRTGTGRTVNESHLHRSPIGVFLCKTVGGEIPRCGSNFKPPSRCTHAARPHICQFDSLHSPNRKSSGARST